MATSSWPPLFYARWRWPLADGGDVDIVCPWECPERWVLLSAHAISLDELATLLRRCDCPRPIGGHRSFDEGDAKCTLCVTGTAADADEALAAIDRLFQLEWPEDGLVGPAVRRAFLDPQSLSVLTGGPLTDIQALRAQDAYRPEKPIPPAVLAGWQQRLTPLLHPRPEPRLSLDSLFAFDRCANCGAQRNPRVPCCANGLMTFYHAPDEWAKRRAERLAKAGAPGDRADPKEPRGPDTHSDAPPQ
jgi:hypothetical protein